jgi:hydroxyacylglutathione hydrolase
MPPNTDPPRPPREVLRGVWLFQSPLWQTNSALVERAGRVLLLDPAYFHPEIEAIRREAMRRSQDAPSVLLTHADFDHTCGVPYLPNAEVIAGEETAERVASGAASEALVSAGPEWGVTWEAQLRVDRIVNPGIFACGPWTVEAIAAASHGREGTSFAVLDDGVLFPGDHLSTITVPLLTSLERAIEANERLLDALGRLDLALVVPGHGPEHTPEEARRIGEEDLAYLHALREAAREAVAEGIPDGYALLRAYEVEPPRSDTCDFAIYGIRAGNARVAVAEARSCASAVNPSPPGRS